MKTDWFLTLFMTKLVLEHDVGKSVIPGSIWAEKICGTNGWDCQLNLKSPL